MHLLKYIQCLLTISCVSINRYSYGADTRATCESKECSCFKKLPPGEGPHFLLLCRGNGSQVLTLGSEIFQDNSGDVYKKVEVSARNFSKVNVGEEFIKKWRDFYLSSLHIRDCSHVYIPGKVRLFSKSEADQAPFQSAMTIISSSLYHLPLNLMNAKFSAVELLRANVSSIRVKEFLRNGITSSKLFIDGSDIGVLEGPISSTTPPTNLSSPLKLQIQIKNSHVGIIKEDALQLVKYSLEDSKINIHNSSIDLVESLSMCAPRGAILSIEASNIGMLKPYSIVIDGASSVDIINNTIGVLQKTLTGIRCSASVNIADNSFVPLDGMCINNSCLPKKIESYVHRSCDTNTLQTTLMKTTIKPTPTVSNFTNENIRTPESRVVPVGYYVGPIIALLLLVLIVIAVLVCVHVRAKQKITPPATASKNTHEESYTYEGSVNFHARSSNVVPSEARFQNVDHIGKDSPNLYTDIRPPGNTYESIGKDSPNSYTDIRSPGNMYEDIRKDSENSYIYMRNPGNLYDTAE